jgi:hypothetical protein
MPQVVDEPLARQNHMPKFASVGARRMPVTNGDRLAILAGEKTEIRHIAPAAWRGTATKPRHPGPCVVYTERADGLVVTDVIWADTAWYEQIAAISEESLKAEGYESYGDWMAYMKRRHAPKSGQVQFGPMSYVRVTRVRRLTAEDIQEFKDYTYDRLYGQYA